MALRTAPACAWPDGQSVLLIGMKMPQDCASEKVNGEMYPGKWTDEIVTNPLCGQMKKGHTQLADRSLTT
jgi:hypothetical protein